MTSFYYVLAFTTVIISITILLLLRFTGSHRNRADLFSPWLAHGVSYVILTHASGINKSLTIVTALCAV